MRDAVIAEAVRTPITSGPRHSGKRWIEQGGTDA
jgi:hypothetical protein